jgi:hypothetical protein
MRRPRHYQPFSFTQPKSSFKFSNFTIAAPFFHDDGHQQTITIATLFNLQTGDPGSAWMVGMQSIRANSKEF